LKGLFGVIGTDFYPTSIPPRSSQQNLKHCGLRKHLNLPEAVKSVMTFCRRYDRELGVAEGDNASRELFERLLRDEEGHVGWLEAQAHQIKELGYERYLSQQIRDEA
jgi:bacterioferritin (cytochrome b1)